MRVLLIGASGGTGRLALEALLPAGHEVRAWLRQPAKLAPRAGLEALLGEARDGASLERAMAGQQAVLSCFGLRSLAPDDLQEALARHLLAAMARHGVRRLVMLSGWGSRGSRSESPLMFKLMRATLLRGVYDDKERAEALIEASDLDYTLVRPGRLLDGPSRGTPRAALTRAGLATSISRADVARFMVEELAANAWLRQGPLLGY